MPLCDFQRLKRQQRQIELDRIEFTAADSRRRVFDQERRRVTDLQVKHGRVKYGRPLLVCH